jgi:hypothetical protein
MSASSDLFSEGFLTALASDVSKSRFFDCGRRFACRSPFTIQMPRGCAFVDESALVQGQAVIVNCGAESEHTPHSTTLQACRLDFLPTNVPSLSRRADVQVTWVLC